MRHQLVRITMLLSLMCTLAGCGGSDSGRIITIGTYAPVSAGSTWSYIRSDNGAQTQTITANSQNRITKEVIDSTAGKSVATISISNNAQYLSSIDLYDTTGALVATKSYTPAPGQLFFPASNLPGTHITQTVQVTTQPANTTSTQNVDITVEGFETVTVPAGIFTNALKIRTVITPGATYDSWFALNVGLVRQDVNGANLINLTSFSIK